MYSTASHTVTENSNPVSAQLQVIEYITDGYRWYNSEPNLRALITPIQCTQPRTAAIPTLAHSILTLDNLVVGHFLTTAAHRGFRIGISPAPFYANSALLIDTDRIPDWSATHDAAFTTAGFNITPEQPTTGRADLFALLELLQVPMGELLKP